MQLNTTEEMMRFMTINDPIVHRVYTQICDRKMDQLMEPKNLALIIMEMGRRQQEMTKKVMQQL